MKVRCFFGLVLLLGCTEASMAPPPHKASAHKMTDQEAAALAQKRWGNSSFASVDKDGCFVGSVDEVGHSVESGRGKTWEEAFADFDHKYARFWGDGGQDGR